MNDIQKNIKMQREHIQTIMERPGGTLNPTEAAEQILAQSSHNPNSKKYIVSSASEIINSCTDRRGSSLKISLEREMYEIEKQKIIIE